MTDDTALTAAFHAAMAAVATDQPAGDGDCLTVAPAVTAHLAANGYPAETITVAGWTTMPGLPGPRAMVFTHVLTYLDGLAGDATAQQYSPDAPPHWVAPLQEYLAQLADLTGVDEVSRWP